MRTAETHNFARCEARPEFVGSWLVGQRNGYSLQKMVTLDELSKRTPVLGLIRIWGYWWSTGWNEIGQPREVRAGEWQSGQDAEFLI